MSNVIRIFRHIDCEGPAHFQTLLEKQAIPYELVRIDEGETVKPDLDAVAGLIFMGGSMSVNDPIKWIADEIALIQAAIHAEIPVLGICLGSQLMAKAMGATIYPGPCMELGWAPVDCVHQQQPIESLWTHELPDSINVFHWHGETFDLPEGATTIFSNERYRNQAFVLGPHLALQFHLEMERAVIHEWLERYPQDLERRCEEMPGKEAIISQTETYLTPLQDYAAILLHRWLTNCDF
ncbi:MAG: type 1 glutamine amidotransferase [Thioalkalispiraceae bacterium]|jgi:GMP synthase-like glutamine amidotransferase